MTAFEFSVLVFGLIAYSIAVGSVVAFCLRWRAKREGSRGIKPTAVHPIVSNEFTTYACRVCGCRWRKWDDAFWTLGGCDSRPGNCCDESTMIEVKS